MNNDRTRVVIQTGFGLAIIVLGAMIGIAVASAWRSLQALNWIEHTRQVQSELNAAFLDLIDAENTVRQFSLIGDSAALAAFEPTLLDVRKHLLLVRGLTDDNPVQQQRLDQLDPLLERNIAGLRMVQQVRLEQGLESAIELVDGGESYETMEQIRKLVRTIGEEENRMLGERTGTSRRWALVALCLTFATGLGTLIAVKMAASRVLREFDSAQAAIGKVHQLNLDLEHRAKLLEEANKELEAFTYSVSHDLRAPLRHIGGFADMLVKRAGSTLDETGLRYLSTISGAARRMGQLIDDLLVFSRMGRAELHKSLVPLDAIVEGVLAELQQEIDGRKVEWKRHPLPTVLADPGLMKLVLMNLLSNALKYTRKQPLAEIEIGAINSGDSNVVIYIRDNGVGFDMTYVDKLFGVFQRLHRAEEFEGTGIGLANVRRIVVRHGGRTWAEGRLDEGATFYFSLPAMEPMKEPARS